VPISTNGLGRCASFTYEPGNKMLTGSSSCCTEDGRCRRVARLTYEIDKRVRFAQSSSSSTAFDQPAARCANAAVTPVLHRPLDDAGIDLGPLNPRRSQPPGEVVRERLHIDRRVVHVDDTVILDEPDEAPYSSEIVWIA
jgi:hypothetical protein